MPEEWTSISHECTISVFTIIKIRKIKGDYFFQEVDREIGDWEDLVFVLWESYGQFRDRIPDSTTRDHRNKALDLLAQKFENLDRPYQFFLPDYTDDMYVAFIQRAKSRILPDGTIL